VNRLKTYAGILGFAFLIAAAARAQVELPYQQTMNVVYAETDGVGLVMDVFTPSGKGRLPAFKPNDNGKGLGIVDVASGGWSSDRGKIEDHKTARVYHVFCARGYTVFAVRPGSDSRFTGAEMLRHINLGIRYVKEHAGEYGVDPDRLGLTGASAGGHLACLAAVKAEDGDPNAKDPLRRHDTRVKAVGVFFPPTDFLNWGGKEGPFDKAAGLFFSGGLEGHTHEEVLESAKSISPIYFVKEHLPPFIFFHGDADPLVPLQQSESMVAALKAKGNSAELIIKPGGGHPWLTIPEEVIILADWFDKQLAGK
jgi:acetyl esterase/lipase